MSELRELLRETAGRIFADLVTHERIERAEAGVWPEDLWRALEENGLTRPFDAEEASWSDAAVLVREAARHAAPVPLAETVLASWLLRRAALEAPEGPLTVAWGGTRTALRLAEAGGRIRVDGAVSRVPFAGRAGHLVVVAPLEGRLRVALVPRAQDGVAVTPGVNLAREPRDAVRFEGAAAAAAAEAPPDLPAEAPLLWGALVRAVQMSGALERVLEEALLHARERVQFGRPIGSFQVIQHMLATLASGVASVDAATDYACTACGQGDPLLPIAVAKIRAGAVASAAAPNAHQVLGAIGFTYEHVLHFATRRLWSWRAEFGSEDWWAERIGRRVLERGADRLWPDVTASR